jgi:hypothetical protein
MEECTCIVDGLCWYHQCDCLGYRNPDCHYHNELERVGATSSYDYAQRIRAD